MGNCCEVDHGSKRLKFNSEPTKIQLGRNVLKTTMMKILGRLMRETTLFPTMLQTIREIRKHREQNNKEEDTRLNESVMCHT